MLAWQNSEICHSFEIIFQDSEMRHPSTSEAEAITIAFGISCRLVRVRRVFRFLDTVRVLYSLHRTRLQIQIPSALTYVPTSRTYPPEGHHSHARSL